MTKRAVASIPGQHHGAANDTPLAPPKTSSLSNFLSLTLTDYGFSYSFSLLSKIVSPA